MSMASATRPDCQSTTICPISPKTRSKSGLGGHVGGDLVDGLKPPAKNVAHVLHQTAPSVAERLVAGVGLQCLCGLRVLDACLGTSDQHATSGGDVEARELGDIGGGGGGEEFLGPRDRLVALQVTRYQGRVRSDCHRGVEVVTVGGPPEPGPQVRKLSINPIRSDT